MAYRLHKFEDAILPFYDPAPDLSQGPVESTLLDSVGGVFDYYSTRQRLPRKQTITIQGVYLGELAYLVDHAGNYIVDHSGNNLIDGTGKGDLQAQLEALTYYLGRRGQLYRQYFNDSTRLQWKTARLLQVSHPRQQKDTPLLANVGCTFETYMAAWRAASATTTTLGAGSGAQGLAVTNGGNVTVRDAILTITAGATVSSVRVQHVAQGVDWAWAGTLASGSALTIDAGAQTILNGSTDAYSGLTYGSAHTAAGILPLGPGTNVLQITTDASVTVSLSHYDQWL